LLGKETLQLVGCRGGVTGVNIHACLCNIQTSPEWEVGWMGYAECFDVKGFGFRETAFYLREVPVCFYGGSVLCEEQFLTH
jgi:hypothetical protein